MNRILVVYYSRSGTTGKVAGTIASALGADLEEIVDTAERNGVMGYVRSATEGMLGMPSEIRRPARNPAAYDLVLVGTPVWTWSVSSPVREYLTWMGGSAKRVGFFATEGGAGGSRAFRQMEELCGKPPLQTLELTGQDVSGCDAAARIEAFVEGISRRLPPVHAAA